ncbi:hypothetical protein A6V36_14920 [Paraburkholderia ginsengiterrae]|uniref:Uncharacterized protein n=1 Tax=Paraburkholderia ginsengiterrae TaxID=1462993 RepID=A0A1A9N652_9BURK|nr:hypothetical protein [Paraburkholderia ginsengiterrae]OAJ51858.1 hypothetical protein A6V36_14920 [Paraburkholderia ginsengiterrae]OAJ59966.1 hypothetical protein A6V37_26305 [Paraburkholderia ginsengiterrae]
MHRSSRAATAALLLAFALPARAGMQAAPYAQQLVDTTLAAHPELTILALHVTPPAGAENVIIASNIGRIGKPADADDLAVLGSGKPRVETTKTGDLSVELPMRDAAGQTIGVIGSTFHYTPGGDRDVIVQQAERVRDELAARTPSLSALFQPAH